MIADITIAVIYFLTVFDHWIGMIVFTTMVGYVGKPKNSQSWTHLWAILCFQIPEKNWNGNKPFHKHSKLAILALKAKTILLELIEHDFFEDPKIS